MAYQRGTSLSGLEFGSLPSGATSIPGVLGQDYFAPDPADFAYIASKFPGGIVRLPFLWERLQPDVNGGFDNTYKGLIDTAIAQAKSNGLQVIIEPHNYGRRYVTTPGGFTDAFGSDTGRWLGASISGGVMAVSQFQRVMAGAASNPTGYTGAPTGYFVQGDVKITATNSDVWNGALMYAFYQDANNHYALNLTPNDSTQKWSLYKVVGGNTTYLASGTTPAIAVGTSYTVKIDVNQGSAGNVVVSIGGTVIATVAYDSTLTGGKVGFFGNGATLNIDNVTLNVNGNTAAGAAGTYRVGDSQLPTSAFADLWTRISTAYKNESGVAAYDLMNEPHDMPVPTTSSTYASTSSVLLMNQAAINAIRGNGDSKMIWAPLDNYSGLQDFTNQWGSSPSWPYTDSLNKTGITAHYYQDLDHSGGYTGAWSSTLRTRINGDATPLFSWAQTNGRAVFVGEYGVPNGTTSDAVNWQTDLGTFLGLMDTYGVNGTQWAMGAHYGSVTTLQPTNNYTTDREQMPILLAHLGTAAAPTYTTKFKQVANNAKGTTVSNALANTTTTMSFALNTGQGAKFPTPGNGFYVTAYNKGTYADPGDDPNMRIGLVTARVGDTLTVTWGQFSTPITSVSGSIAIELMVVADLVTSLQTAVNALEQKAAPYIDQLVYASTINVDVTLGRSHTVNLTGNTTINLTTGGTANQSIVLILIADSTARTVSLANNMKDAGNITVPANQAATVHFTSNGTAFYETSRAVGLS